MSGFFSKLFGSNSDDTRLDQAESYIESQWTSGLTRHYEASDVSRCVDQKAGVKLTGDEAVEVVEKVRVCHGWGRRSHDSYFPSDE